MNDDVLDIQDLHEELGLTPDELAAEGWVILPVADGRALTGDTATDLKIVLAYEAGLADGRAEANQTNNSKGSIMNETISIDGTTYTRRTEPPVWRIVVLQRGWVVVGRWHEDGDDITLTDASTIRRWGTTKGLGELVDGPLADTILDQVGTVRAHRLGLVLTVDAAGWPS